LSEIKANKFLTKLIIFANTEMHANAEGGQQCSNRKCEKPRQSGMHADMHAKKCLLSAKRKAALVPVLKR
jgi:hypothetical protein